MALPVRIIGEHSQIFGSISVGSMLCPGVFDGGNGDGGYCDVSGSLN